MAYSFNSVIASGASNTIALTFPYLDKSHVHVLVNTVQVADNLLVWNDDSTIRLPTTPTIGSVVKAYRDTPKDALSVIFETEATFEGDSFNHVCTQLLYIGQEAYDQGFLPQSELDAAIAYVNQTAQASQASADTAQTKLSAAQAVLTACLAAQVAAENARDSAEEVTGIDVNAFLHVSNALSELTSNAAAARSAIGAASATDLPTNLLRYAAQTLSSGDKAQARTNIGAFSSGGGEITGAISVDGQVYAGNDLVVTRAVAGYTDSGVAYFNDAKSRYLAYGPHGSGGDYYTFGGAHVYSAAGRLWGTSDFNSVIASIRWVNVGDQYITQIPSSPDSVTHGMVSSIYYGQGFNGPELVYRFRQLQMLISGSWYTVGWAS
jgi:hypothetical protein